MFLNSPQIFSKVPGVGSRLACGPPIRVSPIRVTPLDPKESSRVPGHLSGVPARVPGTLMLGYPGTLIPECSGIRVLRGAGYVGIRMLGYLGTQLPKRPNT